jgi:competence protein ComEC
LRKSVDVTGIVADEPALSGGRCRFPLESCELPGTDRPGGSFGRILVSVRLKGSVPESSGLTYGSRVMLRGVLERPTSARNPGDFDARSYYETNGISLLLRVRSMDGVSIVPGAEGKWWMRSLVLPVRRFLLRHIDETIGGNEGELLKGIIIGERSGLSYSLRDAFVRSGTAHILAVSGSNVAVIAAMAFLLLQFLRAGRVVRVLLTTLCVIFYMMLTGGQPPVVRAGIMAIIVLGSTLVQQRPNTLNSLGAAAALIMLLDPRQLFDVGFQLSFAAVLSIVLLYPVMRRVIDRWTRGGWLLRAARAPLRLVALSVAATVGSVPLCALWFGRVSIIGLIANIIVVPAVGVSVFLGVASAFASLFSGGIAGAYAALNEILLKVTVWTAEATGGLSFAVIETPAFRWVDAIAFYSALGFLLHVRRHMVVVSIVLAAALHLYVQFPSGVLSARMPGSLRVTFLDVGQGDAAVVELPEGRTLLVDAGGWSPEYDAGERVVAPYLRRCGIDSVDVLVVTHAHGDHIGGLPAVLRSVPVHTVVDAGGVIGVAQTPAGECLTARAAIHVTGFAGTTLPVESRVRVFVLSPGVDACPQEEAGDNNSSVVLKICYGSVAFLLAGDAGVDAEEAMVSRYSGFLRSSVLKVGHHGSAGSSSERFLEAVCPEYAVISVGAGNAFGHPSETVLERLSGRGIDISRTDDQGAVIFETDGTLLRRLDWRDGSP